ncbi:hypothetical protein BV898_16826 [Hypsibius exemplaris]|uniref:Uncharacterized protein n=1 Tax=Hypsibius exemplaris TaxID=2072580 RepID=A0A9X6RM76_HYPEX|nr:hypothetical protein BV898_16826 [Hypsibius exemplaris]
MDPATQDTQATTEGTLAQEPALDDLGNCKLFVWPPQEGRCTDLSMQQLKLAATQECPSFQYGHIIMKFRELKELGLTITALIVVKDRSEYEKLLRKGSLPVCGEQWDVKPYTKQNLSETERNEKYGSKEDERKRKAYLVKVPSRHSLSSIRRHCEETKSGGLEYVKGIFFADKNEVKFSIGFDNELAAVDFAKRKHKSLGPFVVTGKYRGDYKASKDPRVAGRFS